MGKKIFYVALAIFLSGNGQASAGIITNEFLGVTDTTRIQPYIDIDTVRSVIVFPNPLRASSARATLQTRNFNPGRYQVRIMSSTGVLVSQLEISLSVSKVNNIPLNQIALQPSGLYFVSLIRKETKEVWWKRIIVE